MLFTSPKYPLSKSEFGRLGRLGRLGRSKKSEPKIGITLCAILSGNDDEENKSKQSPWQKNRKIRKIIQETEKTSFQRINEFVKERFHFRRYYFTGQFSWQIFQTFQGPNFSHKLRSWGTMCQTMSTTSNLAKKVAICQK